MTRHTVRTILRLVAVVAMFAAVVTGAWALLVWSTVGPTLQDGKVNVTVDPAPILFGPSIVFAVAGIALYLLSGFLARMIHDDEQPEPVAPATVKHRNSIRYGAD